MVEWQVRRPGAVAQPVVAFQSWLPIGGERHPPPVATKSQPSGGPQPKPTCRTLTDSPPPTYGNYPVPPHRCSRRRRLGSLRPAGARLTDCAATHLTPLSFTLLAWFGLVGFCTVRLDLILSLLCDSHCVEPSAGWDCSPINHSHIVWFRLVALYDLDCSPLNHLHCTCVVSCGFV